jgi:preprotein translocase subunit SecF
MEKIKNKIKYDKVYKYLILIPLIVTLFSIVYMVNFYKTNNDFIYKDITLKGGTSLTIYMQLDINELSSYLSQNFQNFNIREISDLRTGKQEAVIIEVSEPPEVTKSSLENYLNITLDNENSSIEFTGSSIGSGFYKQTLFSVLLAFSLMGMVSFIIFSKGWKIKTLVIFLSSLPLLLFLAKVSIDNLFYVSILSLLICLTIYFKKNIPSFFIVLCVILDIFMTITLINIFGIKLSTAGIVAILMLIGYSVDSDILLTTRVLRATEGTVNERIFSSFKTGMTMTLTTLTAVVICLLITQNFSPALKQIFTILLIGLSFDILNTWVLNTGLIKYYMERKK